MQGPECVVTHELSGFVERRTVMEQCGGAVYLTRLGSGSLEPPSQPAPKH